MTPADVLKLIKEKEVKFVDLRFTDTRGKEQHVSVPAKMFDQSKFEDGHAFDGSSIAGWKGSSLRHALMPEGETARLDPFTDETVLNITCDVVEPADGKGYDRDPRTIAKRAERLSLKSTGLGDTAYFGRPEASSSTACSGTSTCPAASSRSARKKRRGAADWISTAATWRIARRWAASRTARRHAAGHPQRHVPRAEQRAWKSRFITTKWPPGQCEIGTVQQSGETRRLDADPQVHRVDGRRLLWQDRDLHAEARGRRQRLGHAVHQSVWREGQNLFAGNGYAGLSDFTMVHIGGIIQRARAQCHHQPPTPQAPGAALERRNRPGVLGAQPLRIVPHPLCLRPRRGGRSALPGFHGQFVPCLCRDADGGARRGAEQDSTRAIRRQEPLRLAAGRSQDADGVHSLRHGTEILDSDREFLTRGGCSRTT